MSDVTMHDADEHARLLELMKRLLGVQFSPVAPAGTSSIEAEAGRTVLRSAAGATLETPRPSRTSGAVASRPCRIAFASEPPAPFPFRGRTVETTLPADLRPLEPAPGELVLATSQGNVLWTVRDGPGQRRYRSATSLPVCREDDAFFNLFNGASFFDCLVLLEFLHEATPAHERFERPPLRASFIIDDPNLHWPHYGHVDFLSLAARARRQHYHVGMATIPMDSWFVHARAADIFRQYPDCLSLLIHGNNHSRDELAVRYSPAERAALLEEAIRRIESLERKSGLSVSRVMVPPHGACSAEMLAELPRRGFAAACISSGSLKAHNPDKAWVASLGHAPAEFIEGCTVMPRWGLGSTLRSTLLCAAYLGQPMVVRCHQADLKQGPDVLDDQAEFINSLGPVEWTQLSRLARMNYVSRLDGATLRVRVVGTGADIGVPSSARDVVIEMAGQITGEPDTQAITQQRLEIRGEPGILRFDAAPATSAPLVRPARVRAPLRLRFLVRRFATEARDRLLSF